MTTGGTPVTISVTCGKFKYYGTTNGNTQVDGIESDLPTVTATKGVDYTTGSGQTLVNYVTNANAGVASNVATFTITYYGRKVDNDNAANLGTLKAVWGQKEDFPQGYYKADIELAYTTR